MAELLITNLAEVATARGTRPLAGDDQGRVERLPDAEVFCRDWASWRRRNGSTAAAAP